MAGMDASEITLRMRYAGCNKKPDHPDGNDKRRRQLQSIQDKN
jgi:hypothetical protein